jgi:[protein-PII] uridylyltransferase
MPDIRPQSKKYTKSPLLNDEKQLQAQLPSNVDVYHESSLQRTIIEVHANDQIGLLYRITKAIFEHGFDITFARISTECGVAVDTFYIEYINQEQPEDTAQLLALRETLNNIVSHDTGKVRP